MATRELTQVARRYLREIGEIIDGCIEDLLYENEMLRNQLIKRNDEVLKLRKQAPKWISVENRLPEDHDDVLVLVTGECGNITFWKTCMVGAYLGDEGWFCNEYPGWDNPGVTHWMPLPKAPEVEA